MRFQRPRPGPRGRRDNLPEDGTGRSATRVGAGILASRVSGFFRDVVIASFFGVGPIMDAYTAALRIPNILRNLLGEGTLSAAFVPVYSARLGAEDREGARRVARGVLGLVLTAAGLVVAAGVALAPWIAEVFTPGFESEITDLTARLIRILFPMSGVMIAGAWCLGVLTSHRRFLLPFGAPVLWNLAQIGGLLWGARAGLEPLIVVLAWATLVGGILQVLVQIPAAARLAGSLAPTLGRDDADVRTVARNAGPVAASQGIFQVSSLADVVLASLVAGGALAGLYYAQRVVQLPMALFGVSVAVAALPEMSRGGGIEALRPHLDTGLRRILYFVVPATVVFLLYGDLVVGLIYQRNAFGAEDARLVRWILSGYAMGLVATSLVKLFASAFHALQDTRTPMTYAAIAVTVGIAVGAGLMFWMSSRGFEARSATGLAVGGAAGAWLNVGLLRRGLRKRGLPGLRGGVRTAVIRIVVAAIAAAAVSWPLRIWAEGRVGPGDFRGRLILLLAVLAAGAVPYVLIAGSPLKRRAPRPIEGVTP